MPSAFPPTARRILVIGADRALFDLLEEWLAAKGYEVLGEEIGDRPDAAPIHGVIVDTPFDDTTAARVVARIARDYPHTPILMLSARLFAGVRSVGPVAQALRVSGVLPKPVNRDTLLRVVDTLSRA
jgi:DNA-binding response OmpR family regulator